MAGLLRFLLIIAVIYVLYRVLKGWLNTSTPAAPSAPGPGASRDEVDVMVQDPQCLVYLPQHEALRVMVKGEERYFCSEACRDAFLAGPQENKTQGAQ